MQFPREIQEKIDSLYRGLGKEKLASVQQTLTHRYKGSFRSSESLICSGEESALYAISRMPATYSVISTLLTQLSDQCAISNIRRVFDIGSGTGAGYLALKNVLEEVDITLVERDDNMISTFHQIFGAEIEVRKRDIIAENLEIDAPVDLVLCSYVLSEMTEQDREVVIRKLLKIPAKYLLLIDTGTPATYESFMKLKAIAMSQDVSVIAPCMQSTCPLHDDYCQFYARVERSSIHKLAKADAVLSYEDEKYFYLLLSKSQETNYIKKERVIRRPDISTNVTRLKLCTALGVIEKSFSKRDKADYKRAKRVKINDLF